MKLSHPQKAAFTLIELLVVIAIIMVLGALAMAAYSKARLSSDRSTALSKMRQIGLAIQSYAIDNEGYLPCRTGMLTGQSPRYSSDTGSSNGLTSTLAYQLYSYLGLVKPTSTVQYAAPLSHPAYERHLVATKQWDSTGKWATSIGPVFILNKTVTDKGGTTVSPWGDANTSPNVSSIPMAAVAELGGTAKLWAMQDVDQKNVKAITGSRPGWYDNLPKTALLENIRHVMFFDWHIEAIDSAYVQLQSGKTKL